MSQILKYDKINIVCNNEHNIVHEVPSTKKTKYVMNNVTKTKIHTYFKAIL